MPKIRRFATSTVICAFLFSAVAMVESTVGAGWTATSASRAMPACSTCWGGTP